MKTRLLLYLLPVLVGFSLATARAREALYLLPRSSPLLKTVEVWQAEIPEARLVKKALRREPVHNDERLQRWMIVELKDGENVDSVLLRLQNDPAVEIAERAPLRSIFFDGSLDDIPNDPLLVYQWHLDVINAYAAWDLVPDASDIVIGLPDMGIDMDHPDLEGALWTNAAEAGGQFGVDDDGNGYIDDVHGWDAYDWDGNPQSAAGDNHGTHVAGIAAAVQNNRIGISGVAPGVQLMVLRVGKNGQVEIGADIDAIIYAVDNGVDVLSMSYGGTYGTFLERDVMDYAVAHGVVLVAAAGNEGWSIETYPAAYSEVIAVAASNPDDMLAASSNYGWWVDVAAPGVGILSTVSGGYGYNSGTSMACPVVAGIACMVLANEPDLTPEQVRMRIVSGSETLPVSLFGGDPLNGRANAWRALLADHPSLALKETGFSDDSDGDGIIEPGESFAINATVELFGGTAQQASVSFVNLGGISPITGSGTVSMTDAPPGVYQAGSLPAQVSGWTDRGTFPAALAFTVDGFSDTIAFHVPVDPPWKTHSAGNMVASVTDFGAIGYDDYVNEREFPDGVKIASMPQGMLFHGSVMVLHGMDVSDCAYSTDQSGWYVYDFQADDDGHIRLDTDGPGQTFRAAYADGNLHIDQTTTSYPDGGDFVLFSLEIENRGTEAENMIAGIYLDWDIPPKGQNEVFYDESIALSYMTGETAAAGLLALGDAPIAGVRAIYNPEYIWNGFAESDKLTFLTGGTANAESDQADDWSQIVSVNLGTVTSGETVRADFAIVAGTTFDEMIEAANLARAAAGAGAARPSGVRATPPRRFRLAEPRPNPFNGSVMLSVELTQEGPLRLEVYDILGRRAATLFNDNISAGIHRFHWTANDASGKSLASGIYLLKGTFNGRSETRRMVLVR